MRFMTWNVESFFMPGGAFGVTDPDLFEEKVANLAAMIGAHEPDVLGLQEVGDPAALERLKNELGTKYPHVMTASRFDAMHPIRTAALLRRGVHAMDEAEIEDFPLGALADVPQASAPLNAMARGALNFTARIDGADVRVEVMHLKSKLLTYPGGRFSPHDENERARAGGYALFRRASEAVAVRVTLDDYLDTNAGAAVVAMGDLNDGPDAATTQIVYGPPDANLARTDKGDPWRLVNLAGFLPADPPPFSRMYKKHGELIDHILVTTDLARRNVTLEIDTTHVTTIGDQPSPRRRAQVEQGPGQARTRRRSQKLCQRHGAPRSARSTPSVTADMPASSLSLRGAHRARPDMILAGLVPASEPARLSKARPALGSSPCSSRHQARKGDGAGFELTNAAAPIGSSGVSYMRCREIKLV